MPISYVIDQARRLVTSRMQSMITDEEVLRFCTELSTDSRFHPTFNQLHEVEPLALSTMHWSNFARLRYADPFSPDSLRAIVVYSELDYGLARSYQMLHGGRLRVFRSLLDAENFLNS